MFLPENQKKLTNVSIVTLKKFNKKFELAVYPNKLYEYHKNHNIPLLTILHSDKIYKSVATGEECSENDLLLLRNSINNDKSNVNSTDIIHFILQNGYEQKSYATSQHELENIEKQIVELIQNKVLYNNSYISKEQLCSFIKKVWVIKNLEPKKQIGGIIKKLVEIGFERVSFKVEVISKNFENFDEKILDKKLEFKKDGSFFIVKSDVLPEFVEFCESKGFNCIVTKNEIVEEEEIC